MTHYTASHWGIYRVRNDGAAPRLDPYEGDPDPSPIGAHQVALNDAPLRIRRPAVRKSWLEQGPGAAPHLRGREPFVELEWDEALDLAAAEIARVRTAHGNEAIFGGSYGWSSAGRFHHAQSQVHRFLNMLGGYVRSVDTYSLGAGMVILPHILASVRETNAGHTSWDVLAAHTELFVAFGGVPHKNTQISSGGAADHRARAGLAGLAAAGVEMVNIGPVRDNLETGGDVRWIPLRPNTDTAMMLALCETLRAEGLGDADFLARYTVGFDRFAAYLDGSADGVRKTPEWAEAITGVPAETTRALARRMAARRTMVNVTWSLQRAAHGEQPFWAVVALTAILGQIGLPGGGVGLGYGAMNALGSAHPSFPGPTLPQGRNGVSAFIPVARIADMLLKPGEPFTYNGKTHRYPDIRLVYWAGGNPFHHHQDLGRLRKAWEAPDTILTNEQVWNAAARHADIVFPATTTLERDDIGAAVREGHVIAMKKVLEPVGEARDDYRIFCDLSRRLGTLDAFSEGLDEMGWLRRLYGESAAAAGALGLDLPAFETFWQDGIVSLAGQDKPVTMLADFRTAPEDAPLKTPSGKIEIFSETIDGFGLEDCPGHPAWFEPFEWLGAEAVAAYPLHLLSDQPVRRLHSQLDHSPHSQDGKIGGREPVYISEADAAARGIAHGDTVELFNDRGRCLAAAIPTADLMPGVVRLATGAWYAPDETGQDQGGNPNALTLDRGASGLSQGCAAQTCLVEIRRAPDAPPHPLATPPPFVARG